MDDNRLGTARDRDPRGMIEHPDRHPVLLATLGMTEECGDRGVHGEDDVVFAPQLAEPAGELHADR